MPGAGQTWATGFNERIHKKQVLPYLGSSQSYLFPCVSSEPNFYPTNIFGILVVKGSFLNVLKSKKRYCSTKSPCKENINWNHPKSSSLLYNVHLGLTFPNDHQIYILTFILCHQLHNRTQISTDSVLAQPFAILMNAIMVKWLNQIEDMD